MNHWPIPSYAKIFENYGRKNQKLVQILVCAICGRKLDMTKRPRRCKK